MAQTFVFKVGAEGDSLSDLVEVKCPSVFEWGIQSVSASESGRTDDALMHLNRVTQKRKIKLAWNGLTPAEISTILTAFNREYFDVYCWDMLNGQYEQRTFYVGDREGNVVIWTTERQVVETLSFDIIER